MATKTAAAPAEMELALDGRLTLHTAHVRVTNPVAITQQSVKSAKPTTLRPHRLVLEWQYAWSTASWHLLAVKAVGRNGNMDVTVKFNAPEKAPQFVQDAIALTRPTLTAPSVPGPRHGD
jgi:hypothetical protein